MPTDIDLYLERLANCHPGLMKALEALRSEWVPEVPPPTVAMGVLGSALVGVLSETSQADLQRISAAVEDALRVGTEQAKNAAATGFLEAVVARSASLPGLDRFTRELGPLAREYCREWDKFTGCRTPGVWD